MATIKVYDQQKMETGEVVLNPAVFEIEPRPEILNFVVRAQMAEKRAGTHSTKTRGMVSGGGVKPWKQKGTGRARAGSNRSPIWRGGAVIFGPQPRKYGFKVNRKIRALAMRMALSAKFASGDLLVVDKIVLDEPKTKLFAVVAKQLGLQKALLVLPGENAALERSSRNVAGISLVRPGGLSVYDILKNKQLVLLRDSLELIENRLAEIEKERHE